MTESKLLGTWRSCLIESAGSLHLVDDNHHLQFFVGSTESGTPRMVIRSTVKPVAPALSDALLVERFRDPSSSVARWNLSFTLRDLRFTEVFFRLVDDIHSRTSSAPSESAALDRLSGIVDEWRRLLTPTPTGQLSMEELKGLVGELWLLLGPLSADRSFDSAVEGWLGPMGTPQDFWFADTGFHEAKAIGPTSTAVTITSENQLDAAPLELSVLRVAAASEGATGAVTLAGLVAQAKDRLVDLGSSTDGLYLRLQRMGVSLDDEFYRHTWFVIADVSRYTVGPGFPSIRASDLDPGIGSVSYRIALGAIVEFMSVARDRS